MPALSQRSWSEVEIPRPLRDGDPELVEESLSKGAADLRFRKEELAASSCLEPTTYSREKCVEFGKYHPIRAQVCT